MVNNPDLIGKLKKQLKNVDWATEIEKIKEQEAIGIAKIANTQYLEWLTTEFLPKCKNNRYEDESFLYNHDNFSEKDIENENNLKHFYKLLDIIANEQRVKEYYNDSDGFPVYEHVFKYKNKYYEKHTIVGQGSITFIKEIKKPDFATIDFDLYFSKGETND